MKSEGTYREVRALFFWRRTQSWESTPGSDGPADLSHRGTPCHRHAVHRCRDPEREPAAQRRPMAARRSPRRV